MFSKHIFSAEHANALIHQSASKALSSAILAIGPSTGTKLLFLSHMAYVSTTWHMSVDVLVACIDVCHLVQSFFALHLPLYAAFHVNCQCNKLQWIWGCISLATWLCCITPWGNAIGPLLCNADGVLDNFPIRAYHADYQFMITSNTLACYTVTCSYNCSSTFVYIILCGRQQHHCLLL